MLERWFAFAVLLGGLFALASWLNEEPAAPADAPAPPREPERVPPPDEPASEPERAPTPEPARRGLVEGLLGAPG